MSKESSQNAIQEKKATLFSIQADLEAIFEQLEENGGELTPELEEALEVTQSNLSNKLNGYVSAVKRTKAEINICKEEKKRIADVQKRNERRFEAMNMAIRDAVLRFGSENKSGNKFIDLGLNKITVSPSKAVILDTEFIDSVIYLATEFLNRLNDSGRLREAYADLEVMFDSMLSFINNEMSEKSPESNRVVTMNDLASIQCSITTTDSLANIIIDEEKMIRSLSGNNTEIKNATSVTAVKELINQGAEVQFAQPSSDYSVLIK